MPQGRFDWGGIMPRCTQVGARKTSNLIDEPARQGRNIDIAERAVRTVMEIAFAYRNGETIGFGLEIERILSRMFDPLPGLHEIVRDCKVLLGGTPQHIVGRASCRNELLGPIADPRKNPGELAKLGAPFLDARFRAMRSGAVEGMSRMVRGNRWTWKPPTPSSPR
jgi:hypothetical protein